MDLLPILRRNLAGAARLTVACSGGPDSMALLHASWRWAQESGAFLGCAHVDHGLRGRASQSDARFVARFCAQRGIPFLLYKAPVKTWARAHRRGIEDAARTLRYRALAKAAAHFRSPAVATGHTLEDQAETVFMNLLRGAGPAGLAAMSSDAPWPTGGKRRLRRPLLSLGKPQLLAYLEAQGVPHRRDKTNEEQTFLRNRLRPTLKQWEALRPGFYRRVAQTAEILRGEEEYWADRLESRRKRPALRLERTAFMGYHKAEQRRRLRHLFGLARFDVLERVRLFAAGAARGPLAIPGGRVEKTGRWLIFHGNQKLPQSFS